MRKNHRALVSVGATARVHVRGKTRHDQQGSSVVTVPSMEFPSVFCGGRSWSVGSSHITPGKREEFRKRMGKDGEGGLPHLCQPAEEDWVRLSTAQGRTSDRPEEHSALCFPAGTGQKENFLWILTFCLSLSSSVEQFGRAEPSSALAQLPQAVFSEAIYHRAKGGMPT